MKNLLLFLILISGTAFAQTHEPIYKDTVFYGKHQYNDPEFYLEKAGRAAIGKHVTSIITVAAVSLISIKDPTNYKAITAFSVIGGIFYFSFDLSSDVNLHRAGLSMKERTHMVAQLSPNSIKFSYTF